MLNAYEWTVFTLSDELLTYIVVQPTTADKGGTVVEITYNNATFTINYKHIKFTIVFIQLKILNFDSMHYN